MYEWSCWLWWPLILLYQDLFSLWVTLSGRCLLFSPAFKLVNSTWRTTLHHSGRRRQRAVFSLFLTKYEWLSNQDKRLTAAQRSLPRKLSECWKQEENILHVVQDKPKRFKNINAWRRGQYVKCQSITFPCQWLLMCIFGSFTLLI